MITTKVKWIIFLNGVLSRCSFKVQYQRKRSKQGTPEHPYEVEKNKNILYSQTIHKNKLKPIKKNM